MKSKYAKEYLVSFAAVLEYSNLKIMDVKVLKATKGAFEFAILRFSRAMRITASKWKPNLLTSSEALRYLESATAR